MWILFSEEKIFHIDGMYSSSKERIWVTIRDEENERHEIKMEGKLP
jgi:hypothetical protein